MKEVHVKGAMDTEAIKLRFQCGVRIYLKKASLNGVWYFNVANHQLAEEECTHASPELKAYMVDVRYRDLQNIRCVPPCKRGLIRSGVS
jgi:hypothetical protein